MKTITVIGAGRSSSSLIKYYLEHSSEHQFQVVVADQSLETARRKVNNHPNGKTVQFSLDQEEARQKLVTQSDAVMSILPAFLHLRLAKDWLKYHKHLVTASYIAPEMNALNEEVQDKGLVFLNDRELAPGLDHMSAMITLN